MVGGGLVCVSERNVDDFSSDRSGKQNAAICQTAGDTGMRAALDFSLRAARAFLTRVLRPRSRGYATRTRVRDRLDGLRTGPVPACRLLV